MLEIETLRMQIAGNSLDALGRSIRENPSVQLVVLTGFVELAGVEFLEGRGAEISALTLHARIMGFSIMELEVRPFAREDFVEYASWFADPDLNRNLGPMDDAWLELAVSAGEVAGDETWAVLRHGKLVAVVEALVDTDDRSSYMITSVATQPALRGQGIGTAALQHVLDLHKSRGILKHTAKVSVDNTAGQRCAAKAGFVPLRSEPDQYGYIELRRCADRAA